MRRLRESGIVTILLLGLTGCAGVQQRLGWTEPPYLGEESSEERPLSRLAFWRRHRAEETVPSASASGPAEPGRSTMIAGNGTSADDDEDRPGLLRRLPLLGRLWKGDHRDESVELDMPAARYAPGVLNSQSVAFVPPRTPAGPAASTPSRTPAPGGSASGSPVADAKPTTNDPPPSPTTASAGTDRSEEQPLRELSVDLAGARPQVDAAAVPARNAGAPAEAPPAIPNVPDPESQQPGSIPAPPPVPSLGREAAPPPPSASPGGQPSPAAPDLAPVSTDREPSLPSPTITSQPESRSSPASGSWTSTVVSTPGAVWPAAGQMTFSGSSQSLVMTSPQGGYVSGGCEATCGPACKTHKLCPLKKHKQQVIESSVVLPSGQETVSSCEATAPCKVKKPCFLKTWLHHKSGCKTKGCKGCKSCSYCGEPATMVSAQGLIVSPQW